MTDAMMILGDFEFKISTAEFQNLDRRHRQRKAVHQRIGRKAASQHIGAELGSMRLSGHILPHWNGGWGQLDRLRSMANTGRPHPLIDGRGNNLGRWELIKVSEKNSDYFDGSPLRIDFDIALQEYGEDRGNGLDLLALGLTLASRFR